MKTTQQNEIIPDTSSDIHGKYQGWIRSPNSDWEDLIGVVKFERYSNIENEISISSIEFGVWKGTIDAQKRISGNTQDEATFFEIDFSTRNSGAKIQPVYKGNIYEEKGIPIYEILFTKIIEK